MEGDAGLWEFGASRKYDGRFGKPARIKDTLHVLQTESSADVQLDESALLPDLDQKNMKPSIHACKTAFTLIELLVVTAIITILTSLLLLSFSRPKQQAWKAVCLSNLHQIGAEIALYENEY